MQPNAAATQNGSQQYQGRNRNYRSNPNNQRNPQGNYNQNRPQQYSNQNQQGNSNPPNQQGDYGQQNNSERNTGQSPNGYSNQQQQGQGQNTVPMNPQQGQEQNQQHDNHSEDQNEDQIIKLATDKVIFDVRAYLTNRRGMEDFSPKFNIILRNYEKTPNEQVYCLVPADVLVELSYLILRERLHVEFPDGYPVFTGSPKDGQTQSRVLKLRYDASPDRKLRYSIEISNGPGMKDRKTGKVTPARNVQGRPNQQNSLPYMKVQFWANSFDMRRFARKVIKVYEQYEQAENLQLALSSFQSEVEKNLVGMGKILRSLENQFKQAFPNHQ